MEGIPDLRHHFRSPQWSREADPETPLTPLCPRQRRPFIFVINSVLVWFAQYTLDVLKFEGVAIVIIGGFVTYIMAGFLIAIFNLVIHWLLKK